MKDCDDGNLCTLDTCDTITGNCTHTLNTCSEESSSCVPYFCNVTNGQCQPNPVDCNDANPCTLDTCDEYVLKYILGINLKIEHCFVYIL